MLNNLDSLHYLLKIWQDLALVPLKQNNISIVGYKGNIAFHFYEYDTTTIDTSYIFNMLEILTGEAINF